jgi:Mycothiol maleylpyruvate isomerase N-terminal domain
MSDASPLILSLSTAVRRLADDRGTLLSYVDGISDSDLRAPYRVAVGPLGDACESLHDLVAHVLMWDEINLAVLAEAAVGRSHWSLDARWETPEAGQLLNRAGVRAGRQLPAPLLLHRFRSIRDSMLAEFARYDQQAWVTVQAGQGESIGALAQRVWTVPGRAAYRHAAIHLGKA